MTFAMANGFALERLLEPEAASDELFGDDVADFFAGLRALAQERGASRRRSEPIGRDGSPLPMCRVRR